MHRDSPLTDIATSPPPLVERAANGHGNDDSSELSDLGDDDSEAETDKMDFLEDEAEESDLHALSRLTEVVAGGAGEGEPPAGEPPAGKPPAGESAEGDSAKGDSAEGESAEGESAEGESAEGESAEGESAEGESAEGARSAELSVSPEAATANARQPASDDTGAPPRHKRRRGDRRDRKKRRHSVDEEAEDEAAVEDEAADAVEEDEAGSEPARAVEAPPEAPSATAASDAKDSPEPLGEADGAAADSDSSDVDMNEQRRLAVDELVHIEADFARLRDQLYHDKLELLEHELELCLEGSHPELLKIYHKINGFYQDSVKYANANLNYKMRCIDRQTVATRTSIHQDFLKGLMDHKNDIIANTTSLWYKINKERNQMDQLVPDYNFAALPGDDEDAPKRVVKQRTLVELVQQRNALNEEIGVDRGLLEFHGFPAAISMRTGADELLLRRATEEEIEDDMVAMGAAR
ncbi:hypothetical protein ABC855_g4547 [[Candida] zeylanoides]